MAGLPDLARIPRMAVAALAAFFGRCRDCCRVVPRGLVPFRITIQRKSGNRQSRATGYPHQGRGVGGQLVAPQINGTARPSEIRICPTSCPPALKVPQLRP